MYAQFIASLAANVTDVTTMKSTIDSAFALTEAIYA